MVSRSWPRTTSLVSGCRDISNSPFFLDGQRKGRTSVEEEVAGHLLPAFCCDGHKFMSAGR